MLAVGAPGQQHVLGSVGQIGERAEKRGGLMKEDLVGPAHLEELARLRHVLGGRTPVHVTPASPSQTRSSSHTRGTSGCPVLASPARTASRSRKDSLALPTISRAAASGMMPSSACARASAASTSSQDWKRAASVKRAHAGVLDPQGGRLVLHARYLARGPRVVNTPRPDRVESWPRDHLREDSH